MGISVGNFLWGWSRGERAPEGSAPGLPGRKNNKSLMLPEASSAFGP